jgi:hypothetical protein
MGRPASGLDDYLDWQERLENYKASGLEVDVFCLQEGVSRSTFYRWVDRLKEGIPNSMVIEKAARGRTESGEAVFVPISLKASPVEIELPNGGRAVAATLTTPPKKEEPKWPTNTSKPFANTMRFANCRSEKCGN